MPSQRSGKSNPIRGRQMILSLMIAALITVAGILSARGSSGFPNSSEFGFGVRISWEANHYDLLLQTARDVGVDWVGVDLNWSEHWPKQENPPNLEKLDQLMAAAKSQQVNVLLAITGAPGWAMTNEGPNPGLTANFVRLLADRYPNNYLAIELFPGANTVRGWGANPNPLVYKQLLSASTEALILNNDHVAIIAAGLSPRSQNSQDADWEDLEFLKALYSVGADQVMPIVGIRLEEIFGDPLSPPENGSSSYSLRHYEEVRQTMLEQGHRNGLIWITGLSWSASGVQPGKSDLIWVDHEEQMKWMARAYHQIKSQLYIGAAFFDSSNAAKRAYDPPVASQDGGQADQNRAASGSDFIFIREMNILQSYTEKGSFPTNSSKVITNQSYKYSLKSVVP